MTNDVHQTHVDWAGCSIVEKDPEKLGGTPTVRGTRLPVEAILDNFDHGLGPDQIAEVFDVAVADVHVILAFREQQLGPPDEQVD